ncbi:ribose-5-phosphate isomerase A [Weissella confusa]|uniref:ribose-5-phosphate isomerase n=1 Tax=Weissella confusa TaxID=1583 RepID=A0A923NIF9_WEICO|nr:ribose-5-phosphate isomerase A [Weissella confusa]
MGIPLADVDAVDYIDLTVDGADAVDPQLNGIKGGGAALLYEKVVAKNSKRNIWIVDGSKQHAEDDMLDKIQQQKKAAGEYAASLVENGMVVGLGTGSTVRYFVDRLGERVANEGLDIVGVTTSNRTAHRQLIRLPLVTRLSVR